MQPIYQNPYASLDPRFTVSEIISEPLEGFRLADRKTVDQPLLVLFGSEYGRTATVRDARRDDERVVLAEHRAVLLAKHVEREADRL